MRKPEDPPEVLEPFCGPEVDTKLYKEYSDMTKICQWCKCEFKADRVEARYCSNKCAAMARRKLNFEKREARAKKLGLTIEELDVLLRSGYGRYLPAAERLGITVEEAKRRVNEERYARTKAKAAERGMGVKEYIKAFGQGRKRGGISSKRPKTYAEIRAANRKHPLVSGWRGAPVMGGGSIQHNDPYLKPSEYVRV